MKAYKRTTLVTVAVASLLMIGAAVAARAGDPPASLEAIAVESATTPAQHAVLAEYFRAKAADARAEAKRHEAMGRTFDLIGRSKSGASGGMAVHCDTLRKNAESDATEYDALAAVHAAAAGSATASAKSLEELLADSVTTAAGHEALASYYREAANAARAEAVRHQRMSLSYGSKSGGAESGMRVHCANLEKSARSAAAEYDALVAEHEAAAKKAAE